jgi:competence protein ComEC
MSSLRKLNLLLLALIVLIGLTWSQRPDPKLKLVFCNVGQGDATLVVWHDRQILVDGGPNNSVLDCLGRHLPFWDRRLELVIASHAESDHITGLIEVVRRFEVERFLAVNEVNDTAEYRELLTALSVKEVETQELVKGAQVLVGPVKLNWLWPETKGSEPLAWKPGGQVLGAKESLNEESQVILASFGNFDWLLTGDIDTQIEKELLASGSLSEVELVKVGHHGSKYSTSADFLKTISPELAVISVGKNSFGHPTNETLERLRLVGAQIERTDLSGDIVIFSDGMAWWQN